MKLKQIFKSAPIPKKIKVKEAAEGQCGGNRKAKAKAEDEELTAITSADYAEWLKQIGMTNSAASVNVFKDAAWDVIDNDPKLESATEDDKARVVSKLWKMYKGS